MATLDGYDAPGLVRIRKHRGGPEKLCWRCNRAAKRAGWEPTLVRLHGAPQEMAAACQRLQAQMMAWLAGQKSRNPHAYGTLGWLAVNFQTDPESDYRDLRAKTQRFYDQGIAIIVKSVGKRRIDAVNGRDVARWYKSWSYEGEALRRGKAVMQTLRRIVSDGVTIRVPGCKDLSDILSAMEFKNPPRRETAASHQLVVAFQQAAKASRDQVWLAIARGVVLQFETGLRQRDVIGEWVRDNGGNESGSIRANGRRWQWGLTWSHIDQEGWKLEKPTSKSNGQKVSRIDLSSSLEAQAALMEIPPERRIGPVIVDPSSGLPFAEDRYRKVFRLIADKAGWPSDMQNRDIRAGAITEAREGGAALEDRMAFATHEREQTARNYERPDLSPSTRVFEARNRARKAAKNQK